MPADLRRIGDRYVGPLLSQPQLFEPEDNGYLEPAAEVPFMAEHVIDVQDLPEQVQRAMFSEPPTKRWT